MGTWSLRDLEWHSWGHTVRHWQSWDLNTSPLVPNWAFWLHAVALRRWADSDNSSLATMVINKNWIGSECGLFNAPFRRETTLACYFNAKVFHFPGKKSTVKRRKKIYLILGLLFCYFNSWVYPQKHKRKGIGNGYYFGTNLTWSCENARLVSVEGENIYLLGD